jgi:excisionase family DNA binding protein
VAGEVRYYSVDEAARVLRLTPERVLEMLEAGELEGIPIGGAEGWRIPIHGDVSVPPPPVTAVPAERPTGEGEARNLPEERDEPELPPVPVEVPRQLPEASPGDSAARYREPTSESGWVTTQQAARALDITARTVRWHIERGNLEAKPEGEGVERTWRVSVDSLNAFRDARQRQAQPPRGYRADANPSAIAAESPGSAVRELADRLVEEARRAEEARVRLELSERAESTLREELAEERRRREAAEREREDAQRERDELRRRLEASSEPEGEPEGERDGGREVPRELGGTTPPREVAPAPPEVPEVPAQGFGTDAAGGGPQRQVSRRWWRRWRRS